MMEKIGPYDIGRVYCGDCVELIKAIPRDNVLIISDPPYGIGLPCNFKSRGRSNLGQCNDYSDVVNDDKPFDPQFLLELDVPMILWGANYYADKLPPSSGWLVWDKERPDNLDQATCELAWTNFVKGVRRFRHLWNGMMRASEHGENYHPTQKPVALIKWCLSLRWMPKNAVIVDPFAGSGSTGIACVQMKRKFVGFEIVPALCQMANDRIDAATRGIGVAESKAGQRTLFD